MMFNKKTIFVLLAVMLLGVVSLAGCGSATPTTASTFAGVLTQGGVAYYVNAATGADTNSGASSSTPFKTITKALNTISTRGGGAIYVASGTYNAALGEVFPLRLSNNVHLIGDIPNNGSTTVISGWGAYTLSGTSTSVKTTLVVPPGVVASVYGLKIAGSWDVTTVVDGAGTNATLLSNNFDGISGTSDGIWIGAGATATLTNNIIRGANWAWGGLLIVDHSTVTLTGNDILDSGRPSVFVAGTGTANTSPVVDMGAGGRPGNNTIIGSTLSVGLSIVNDPNTINVSGNIWKPNVQGSDAAGHYALGFLVSSVVPIAAGNNYAASSITSAPSILFYTAPSGNTNGTWPVLVPTRMK